MFTAGLAVSLLVARSSSGGARPRVYYAAAITIRLSGQTFVAIIIVVTLIAIYQTDPVTYIRQTKLPFPDVATLFLVALIPVFCDKNIFSFLQPYHQVLE